MGVIEQIEKHNFEDFIMSNLHWTKEQKEFLGTLIYNVGDSNGNEISTIVCKRTESKMTVNYIYPNENDGNATEFALVYDKQKKDVDYTKTTDNVVDFNEAKLFISTMSEMTKQTKPVFYPVSKINPDIVKDKTNIAS